MTTEEWHQKIRAAFSALDVALRGELPDPSDSIAIGELRIFVDRLDSALFEGFGLVKRALPSRARHCELKLEDLEL